MLVINIRNTNEKFVIFMKLTYLSSLLYMNNTNEYNTDISVYMLDRSTASYFKCLIK